MDSRWNDEVLLGDEVADGVELEIPLFDQREDLWSLRSLQKALKGHGGIACQRHTASTGDPLP